MTLLRLPRWFLFPTRTGALLLALAGCGGGGTPSASPGAAPGATAGGGPAPPPPEVVVHTVRAGSVPQVRELVGRLSATRSAEVRARVAGIVKERAYIEGTDVEAGDLLFQIEPGPFEARVNSRKAALNQARVNAGNAREKAKRLQELSGRGVVSRQDLDDAEATARSADAAVQQAQADLELVQMDLYNARVVAPIAGRAGKALVTEGALVGQGEVTLLTTVEQIDPIYVSFSQSQSEYERLRRQQSEASGVATVQIRTADGSDYGQTGSVDFSDLAVDPQTGAIALRATLPNPERALLPGMFVNVLLTQGELAGAMLVPQLAVQRDALGPFALALDAEGKVVRRDLQLEGAAGSDWIVRAGLKDGEQVIVSGLQKARVGQAVKIAAPGEESSVSPGASPSASK